jgi:hypothetical protein
VWSKEGNIVGSGEVLLSVEQGREYSGSRGGTA